MGGRGGSSGIGGGGGRAEGPGDGRGQAYKGMTANGRGIFSLGSGATESQALDVANNAPFTETSFGSIEAKQLGVTVRDSYTIENTDGSTRAVTRDVTYSANYGQNSDGSWFCNGKTYRSEAAAQRNARKLLAKDISEEIGWGRTLSMRTGDWKRR